MVHAELFDSWDAQYGPFHADGCTDEFGANKQIDNFWSHFQAHNCDGLNVYANPPLLQHYSHSSPLSRSKTSSP